MTITEFLLARIAEDEVAAKECLLPKNLHPYGDERVPAIGPSEWGDLARNYLGGPMGEHCAQHDPTRVLRECAAKRAIIDAADHGYLSYVAPLAAAYSDHPDYQQKWAL